MKKNVRAIIVDDEPLARQRLRRLLANLDVDVVAEGENGEQAIELVKRYDAELLFLDINMPIKNGIEAAKSIVSDVSQQAPSIIFCTAYDEYAMQAFEVNANAYILKPINQESVLNAIQRASKLNALQVNQLSQLEAGESDKLTQEINQELTFSIGTKILNVPIMQIVYFYSSDKNVFAYLNDTRQILVDNTLKQLELDFPNVFIRNHRSYLTNCHYINEVVNHSLGQCVMLKLDEKTHRLLSLPISRRHYSNVKQRFSNQ